MKRCILIGGIGSGKSTVSGLLQAKGAVSVDLDECGHVVLEQPEVIDQLVSTFGETIVSETGEIDRAELARLAFARPEDTVRLNAITQPRLLTVAQDRIAEYEKQGASVVLIEISAYDGPDGTFAPLFKGDPIIAVLAPTSIRIKRAVAKGFDESDVRNRIKRQVSDEQRALWATYVISNKGTLEELADTVETVWQSIVSS